MSTKILIMMNISPINSVLPITTGKSKLKTAFMVSKPIPFQLNTFSTKKAPASKPANHPDTAVTTGFRAFLKACL